MATSLGLESLFKPSWGAKRGAIIARQQAASDGPERSISEI
jgi:hypothetical protein